MKVIIADNAGFCGGVRRAIDIAEKNLSYGPLTSLGPIVHNNQEVKRLESMGMRTADDMDSILQERRVLVRAHGGLKSEIEEFNKREIEIIDTTCPIVRQIRRSIVFKEKEGYFVVIIGDINHPEIQGMVSELTGGQYQVVNTEEDARNIAGNDKVFVVSQTTNRLEKFENLAEIIRNQNHNVVVENTICNATHLRQESCRKLAEKVDAMLVIGGRHSSNTQKLAQVARHYCKNVYHIEESSEIPLHNLIKFNTIGITAGASTPSWLIEEVVRRMDQFSNEELMEEMEGTFTNVRAKEIVKGEIIYVTDNEVMVNIGYKSDGIIKQDELSDDPDVSPKDLFEEGQEIEVYVIKLDDGEGNVVLSARRVAQMKNWEVLADMHEKGELVEAEVQREVKGGLIATVMGINGFIPGSQLAPYYVKDLKPYVGKTLECEILSVDPRKRRLILSRKSVVVAEQKAIEDKVWDKIEVGSTIEGTVARLTDFGAFVNLGGVDGLLHISDISWNRIDHPKDVLNVGDELTLKVLRANRERNRISLGLKQLQPKPFDVFMENNKVGDIVKGKVMNLVDFGAFVKLEEGVEGLVHVSEISYDRVEKPSDELNIDQEVEVKILNIDSEKQRIGLSIKATKPDERPAEEKPKPKRRPKRKNVQKNAPISVTSQSDDLENVTFGNSVLGDLDLSDWGLMPENEDRESAEIEAPVEEVAEAEEDLNSSDEVEQVIEETEELEETVEPEETTEPEEIAEPEESEETTESEEE